MSIIWKKLDRNDVYSTNLSHRKEGLSWVSNGNDTLIVKCPYGFELFDYVEFLVDLLDSLIDENNISEWNSVNIADSICEVKLVSYKEVQRNGFNISSDPASYYIFPANKIDGDIVVFKPSEKSKVRRQRVDISKEIVITYAAEMKKTGGLKGLIGNEFEHSGFLIVDTDKIELDNFNDGDIYFEIDGFRIPMTKKMLKHPVYVKDDRMPKICSAKAGFNIILKEVVD